jgi:hypothetical protein
MERKGGEVRPQTHTHTYSTGPAEKIEMRSIIVVRRFHLKEKCLWTAAMRRACKHGRRHGRDGKKRVVCMHNGMEVQ